MMQEMQRVEGKDPKQTGKGDGRKAKRKGQMTLMNGREHGGDNLTKYPTLCNEPRVPSNGSMREVPSHFHRRKHPGCPSSKLQATRTE